MCLLDSPTCSVYITIRHILHDFFKFSQFDYLHQRSFDSMKNSICSNLAEGRQSLEIPHFKVTLTFKAETCFVILSCKV